MDRLPYVVSVVSLSVLGAIAVMLLKGESAGEIVSTALIGTVVGAVVALGSMRWKGLPFDISTGEARRRRNEVYRVPIGDDTHSG